jgi:hypothetical protein
MKLQLTAVAPGAGDWEHWNTVTLGTLKLSAGMQQPIPLKAQRPPSPGVTHFVRLELSRVDTP